jgi:sugar (pentulose or hexulose) kinase
MRSTLFVGLDVGTKTSKAVVFTEAGDAIATTNLPTPHLRRRCARISGYGRR